MSLSTLIDILAIVSVSLVLRLFHCGDTKSPLNYIEILQKHIDLSLYIFLKSPTEMSRPVIVFEIIF
jgi:hypothetical protein